MPAESSTLVQTPSPILAGPRPSRPSMLPHSMSLGPLPPPEPLGVGGLPSGQRSVPATAAGPRDGRPILGSSNKSGGATPDEGPAWPTTTTTTTLTTTTGVTTKSNSSSQPAVLPRPGNSSEGLPRRHSTFDVWKIDPEPSAAASLEAVDERPRVPAAARPLDKMPDLIRGQSMPHVPSSSLATGRLRSAIGWDAAAGGPDEDDGAAAGSPAAMESLRRDSTSARSGGPGASPVADRQGRPLLNRAPGSRDNLSSALAAATTNGALTSSSSSSSAVKKPSTLNPSPMFGGEPAAADRFRLPVAGETSPTTTTTTRRMHTSDMAASAAAASAELTRQASQQPPPPKPYLPSTESLADGMSGLGLQDVPPLQVSSVQRGDESAFAPTPTPVQRQVSQPGGEVAAAAAVAAAYGAPGWNPFYMRSPIASLNPALSADGTRYQSEPRRDSGYGPSPTQTQELRRGSYSPGGLPTNAAAAAASSALAYNAQLRRSQSSWVTPDAVAAATAAAAAASQVPRHPSFSFASPWQAPSSFGASPALGFGTLPSPSPSLLPSEAALAGSLLPQHQQQQQQLRSSLAAARHSLDYGQLPSGAGALHYGGLGPSPPYPSTARSSIDSGRNIVRSSILEEFRANRHRRWDLRDLLGNIAEFAGDQLGSRHIQSKLDVASAEERELVFAEVLPNLLQLSMDVFANYVVQKFFELGTQPQKGQLADKLRGHVLELSLQMYGCRVIQKALEHVIPDMQRGIIKELELHVMQCAKDQNANHVLQRSLERMEPAGSAFITQTFAGHAFDLATHPYGCRVLQRAFEHLPEAQVRPLIDELHGMAQHIFLDSYGNYIAQWIITEGPAPDSSFLIGKIKGQSNVVEKAIVKANEHDLRALLDEVLAVRADGASTVGIMLKDAFANFPLQKFLQTAREPQRAVLFDETATQLMHLRRYSLSYGKYLVAIERLIAAERGPLPFQSGLPLPHMMISPGQYY